MAVLKNNEKTQRLASWRGEQQATYQPMSWRLPSHHLASTSIDPNSLGATATASTKPKDSAHPRSDKEHYFQKGNNYHISLWFWNENEEMHATFGRSYSMQLKELEERSDSPVGGVGWRYKSSSSRNTSYSQLERAYSSCSSVASTSSTSKMMMQQQLQQAGPRDWVRRVWSIHFLAGLTMLMIGMWNNHWSR